MTILIIGANGMLARALRNQLTADGLAHEGLDLPDFDITDAQQVDAAIKPSHTAVINCSAYTNVDAAETDEATASRVNGLGVSNLASACAQHDVPLVHFSTDYVFSGYAAEPYKVDEPLKPLGAYGRSKALGEQALRAAGGPFLLLRTSWLYAPWANNFVRTIFKASRERPLLKVVNDQRGRPSSAEYVASVTLLLLAKHARGAFHVTDGGECTWYEFAKEIVRLSGHSAVVQPCTSDEYDRPAKRPPYSVLDLAPTEALVGPLRDWRLNLADVMSRLEPV